MKVLMFGWEFPPHISGGLGTACYGLVKGMNHHNQEVIFVVPKLWGDEEPLADFVNASAVTIDYREKRFKKFWKNLTYLEVSSFLVPYLGPEQFKKFTDYAIHDRTDVDESIFSNKFEFSGKYGKNLMEEVSRYALVAAQIARDKNNFDIIHAHDWLAFPAGIAAKEISGKPLVVHVHATEYDRSGETVNQPVYDIERAGMHAADHIVAVSQLTKNIIIRKYGIPASKVTVLHNAVLDASIIKSEYEKKVPEKIVTFLGRITFQKGPEYFVEAAKIVIDRDPNVRFVMAGNGDLLNRMIDRVAELRMATKFHFTGFLKGDDVDHMYAISDVYVMPSVSEPFGIAPLEAVRHNTPVIISKQSGVAEVLRNAIKVDFWDVDSMADAIFALLHYEGISKMFKELGSEELKKLKWEHVAAKLVTVYEKTLAERS
ncbi:MAG: glycosyltransferase family 4 protein [Algoriphagus sp.]|jgi:glycosyltransferase involved in cell wall biosynthesis|uniref:glycosyltransferase family 4 protein n=1 Tax=Algoriphagus sp. TaxID=1872435 RepID=UPI002727FC8C|nr:glycosyltransferase family 4 protein [Algoriphagus sp.]MDO8968248.1 glycosyltransferase family 4 protein [Algoriphagus sp.]MDP2039553.1 glycosyltransferase family 4 protein [Algoriphagus sp.]MDP3200987.1 glycosyltransferase family 4 protein [Algoriphagus sp.]MDP3472924.1 glycosyltransferase family 4 protein [Algoriphagus sp.]